MTPQESDKGDTRFDFHPAPEQEPQREEFDDAEDLPISASNRAIGITLGIGVGLMILVLMLPYISNR